MAKDKTYPPHVCVRLDRLSEARTAEKAREQTLIKARKSLKEDFGKIGWGSTTKHKDLALEYVQTVFEIDHCRARQKDLADKIDETIANAHQGELFDNDDLDKLTRTAPIEEVVKAVAGGAGEDDDEDQVKLPVGGPSAKEPPKKPGLQLAGTHADGVDEHLQASVNELDMREDLKGLCIAAGFDTIAKLVHVLDGPGGRADLSTQANLSENKTATVAKAVSTYRKEHRSAMREAETGT